MFNFQTSRGEERQIASLTRGVHAGFVLSGGTKHPFTLFSAASTCRSGYQVLFLTYGFCIHMQSYRLCGGEVCVQWTLQNYTVTASICNATDHATAKFVFNGLFRITRLCPGQDLKLFTNPCMSPCRGKFVVGKT